MKDRYYIGMYWSSREESSLACSERLLQLLQDLQKVDQIFERWVTLYENPARNVSLTIDEIETLVLKGRNYNPNTQQYVDNLGFRVSLRTSHEPEVRLTFICGTYAEGIPNHCLVVFPTDDETHRQLLTDTILRQIFKVLVKNLAPDWGVFASDEFREAISSHQIGKPFAGWMTYLSSDFGLGRLPEETKAERLPEGGKLLILPADNFDPNDESQISLADSLTQSISPS